MRRSGTATASSAFFYLFTLLLFSFHFLLLFLMKCPRDLELCVFVMEYDRENFSLAKQTNHLKMGVFSDLLRFNSRESLFGFGFCFVFSFT